ncbi:MurR/RpiR family transcriptional regulator [Entomospira culicis]|uniref:MurR/RpiR family transcriptional regulator n=1 Tax=Entomospira culicis TaxID=2719989 RepID=A0A968GKD1_9SPIO|nr:SIS domain-containing protein [Entomospira culicis]NIZ19231.1 MurR/RpiR family transcriptional regulator [Entomospira culicis]NIZ69445.1 MurR/RpiR family transcriptional regulator [Entomospira culicis]WDI36561.1 SIS domain-containing protein [Entomospira culicis]WDI38187.1 SIS domain-containing protein [Entomospira culicis]
MRNIQENLILLTVQELERRTQATLSVVEEEIIFQLIPQAMNKHFTMQKLANQADTSISAIARLINTLGFSGYAELKLTLNQIYQEIQQSILPSAANASLQQDLHQLYRFSSQQLQHFIHHVDLASLEYLITSLRSAQHIVILATGFSAIIAQSLAYQLQQLGKYCNCVDTIMPDESFQQLLKFHSLVITISKSAQTPVLERRMQDIQRAQLPNIMITTNPKGLLCQYTDKIVTIADYTQRISPDLTSLFQLKMIFFCEFLILALNKS